MATTFAEIKSVRLEIEDHGILTLGLRLDFEDGSSQNFGGYTLDAYSKAVKRREGTACGLDFILRLLNCFCVQSLDQLVGKTVKVHHDDTAGVSNRKILGLEVPGFAERGAGNTFIISDWLARWAEGSAP